MTVPPGGQPDATSVLLHGPWTHRDISANGIRLQPHLLEDAEEIHRIAEPFALEIAADAFYEVTETLGVGREGGQSHLLHAAEDGTQLVALETEVVMQSAKLLMHAMVELELSPQLHDVLLDGVALATIDPVVVLRQDP